MDFPLPATREPSTLVRTAAYLLAAAALLAVIVLRLLPALLAALLV